MKYLKIHVLQPKGGQMVYPTNYQSEIGDYNQNLAHLYYNDDKGECYLLLTIEDADYKSNMIRDRVEEITETEAKSISEANETRTEAITDEARVRRLEIKSRLGQTLTTDELKALDPNDPIPGFGYTKIFADMIDDLKAREATKVGK